MRAKEQVPPLEVQGLWSASAEAGVTSVFQAQSGMAPMGDQPIYVNHDIQALKYETQVGQANMSSSMQR